jgi:hypothetical protein
MRLLRRKLPRLMSRGKFNVPLPAGSSIFSRPEDRVVAQLLVIVDVFIAQSQSVDSLREASPESPGWPAALWSGGFPLWPGCPFLFHRRLFELAGRAGIETVRGSHRRTPAVTTVGRLGRNQLLTGLPAIQMGNCSRNCSCGCRGVSVWLACSRLSTPVEYSPVSAG